MPDDLSLCSSECDLCDFVFLEELGDGKQVLSKDVTGEVNNHRAEIIDVAFNQQVFFQKDPQWACMPTTYQIVLLAEFCVLISGNSTKNFI